MYLEFGKPFKVPFLSKNFFAFSISIPSFEIIPPLYSAIPTSFTLSSVVREI